jgi:FkbM family methyltransferase
MTPTAPQCNESRLAGWLLRQCLGPPCGRRRIFRIARKRLLRFWHPPYRARYYGQDLLFPGRHDLIVLTNDLPLFNTPLRRLARAVRASDGGLRMLDIGANIGEGVALVDPTPGDRFWLVEGSNEFLPFLRRNVAGRADTEVIPTYLGEAPSVVRGSEVVVAGNAHLSTDAEGEISFDTLDRLFPDGSPVWPNLLKIDVEGHEPLIFRGGFDLLSRHGPVVFMEWYPKLLAGLDLDVLSPLNVLRSAGYTDAVVYDNHGLAMECVALGDEKRLRKLADYSRMRDLFYFDLTVFGHGHTAVRDAFCQGETAFYGGWGSEAKTGNNLRAAPCE